MFENWPNDLIYNTANCFLDNAFSPTQKVSLAVLHSFCLLLGQFQPELACKSVTIKKVCVCLSGSTKCYILWEILRMFCINDPLHSFQVKIIKFTGLTLSCIML